MSELSDKSNEAPVAFRENASDAQVDDPTAVAAARVEATQPLSEAERAQVVAVRALARRPNHLGVVSKNFGRIYRSSTSIKAA